MKEFLRGIGALALLLAGAVLLPAVSVLALYSLGIPSNEIRLYRTRTWYEKTVPHPPSRSLSRFREMGNFGNSNHCDFAVGEIRVSPLPYADIKKFYDDMPIGRLAGKEEKGMAIWIAALSPEDARDQDSWFSSSGAPFRDEFRQLASATTTERTIYMVVFVDAMYPAGFDLRCH